MNYVIFYWNISSYSLTEWSSANIYILGHFLTSDFSSDGSNWLEWLQDDQWYTSSNATNLEKENGFIIMYDIWDEEESGPFVKLKKEVFKKLIHDWYAITRLKPRKIKVIWHEDGTISVEGE